MARANNVACLLIFALITHGNAQFFDLFQQFRPYLQPVQTTRRPSAHVRQRPFAFGFINTDEQALRQPVQNQARDEDYDQENSRRENSGNRGKENKNQHAPPATNEYNNNGDTANEQQGQYGRRPQNEDAKPIFKETKTGRQRKATTASQFEQTSTTNKPWTSQSTNRQHKPKTSPGNNNRRVTERNEYTNDDFNSFWNPSPVIENNSQVDRKKNKRRPAQENGDKNQNYLNNYTQRPTYQEQTTKPPYVVDKHTSGLLDNYDNEYQNSNHNSNNAWTTENPFAPRPATTKRNTYENRYPTTSRPIQKTTQWSSYNEKPNEGPLTFPATKDGEPELVLGPDVDYMSDLERRKYVDAAERMCEKYKSFQVMQLAAIPLLPSPEPVEVNITRCVPINVPLVVGGKVASIQEFPHMALLGWNKLQGGGYFWKCGGSLISEQFVLTAAHCAYQERDNNVVTGPPRVVQLGSSFLDDPGAIVIKVATSIRHPKYMFPRSYYDLAVLKLANKVTFSERIKPACLGAAPAVGRPVIATGWGRTEFGGDQSQELRSVSIAVWRMSDCYNILGTSRKLPNGPSAESQLCAGEAAGGKDTCQGDSGGPVQLQDGCIWRVVGVTSLGRSCGAVQTPGLYAIANKAFIASVLYNAY